MHLARITFDHRRGKFDEIDYHLKSSPEEGLPTVKEYFSHLEKILDGIYCSPDYRKEDRHRATQNAVSMGVDYLRVDGQSLQGAIAEYSVEGTEKLPFKTSIYIGTRGPEEQLLRVYDIIMSLEGLEVAPSEMPIVNRIKLLKEGKRGEELISALYSSAETTS